MFKNEWIVLFEKQIKINNSMCASHVLQEKTAA